ncbi:MAG: hypothetical protein GTO13_03765 [Proteobacteria bacterium]|nr:hypothetical protein [Pseudomonadota bacterium]
MCHIVLLSPVLALPLFFFLPFSTALLAYVTVVFTTGFVYFKIVVAMKCKICTGIEGMTEGEAVVIEDIDPEGKVKFENEIWTASAQGKRFRKGMRVRICDSQGLKLIVGSPYK